MNSRLVPPDLGATDNSTFFDQPQRTCPPGSMLNVRPFTVSKDRPQVGLRPGILKAFAQQMGSGAPVQACGVVSRARAITGARVGDRTAITDVGRSIPEAALAGQVWGLQSNFGMYLRRDEDVSAGGEFADTGPSDPSVVAIAYTPDQSKLVYAENYIDASAVLVSRVTCIDAQTGETQWSHKITRTGAAYSNSIVCTALYAFVCTNQYVRALKIADGTQFGTEFDCNGWSQECIQAILTPDSTALLIIFRGTSANGTPSNDLPSGVHVLGAVKASMWRSGVMEATIQAAGSTAALVGTVLGAQLPSTDRYYEGPSPYNPHNYLRFSECLAGCGPDTPLAQRMPRGVWPTAIAPMPDGGFIVSHTNTGWGPDSNASHVYPTKPGNDYSAPGPPYRTLSIFAADGTYIQSLNTFSIFEAHTVDSPTTYSDIPYTSDDQPSILALATDSSGNIYAAGRVQSAIPANVFCFDRDGNPKWSVALSTVAGSTGGAGGQHILENGAAVCGDDQNPLFGGTRSTTWPGASGAHALLWKLDKETGAVLDTYDLGAAVSCLGIASNARGDIAFCSDHV